MCDCPVPAIEVGTLIISPSSVLIMSSGFPSPLSLEECAWQCGSMYLCICVAQAWIGRSFKDAGTLGCGFIQISLIKQLWLCTYCLMVNFTEKIITENCAKMVRALCMFMVFDLEIPYH